MNDSCFLPDRYTQIEELSRGTHTSLVRAHDKDTDSPVALKLIHAPAWMTPAESEGYLTRAAATLAPFVGVTHSGLATVFHHERTNDCLIIAREFVPGRPLSHLIQSQGILGQVEARRIADEVGRSLDAIAEIRFQHRALTSDNVIVRETGEFVVTDSGVAFAARQFSVAGMSCCFRKRHEIGGDIHALAGLVFQAITGIDPDFADALGAVELPRGMRDPIRRALARDRAAYRTAAQFAESLKPIPASAIFRHVWRPAAAAGLLASLATLGGNAVSEARRSARHVYHPPTPIMAAIPVAVMVPNIVDTLSPQDTAALTTAVRRHGFALLANPAVAQLLDVNQSQRLQIAAFLADHRNRVGQIVETAAVGSQIDSATAMTELKVETGARILNTLNATQRARWEQVERASSQPGEISQ